MQNGSSLQQIRHIELCITGLVQGVGFRPFIYNVARSFGILGFVQNNSQGVLIKAEGSEECLHEFMEAIRKQAPAASRIDTLDFVLSPLEHYTDFKITESEILSETFTQISPDLALCEDCQRELEDSNDRRFSYPFINCTNCGPRFTIILDVPYDRPMTTMCSFAMCEDCAKEYKDPSDRRFHAQPIACAECGPEITSLVSEDKKWMKSEYGDDAIREVAEVICYGGIALIQGIGGFHLACDALNDTAVRDLRKRKHREEKPLAVMFPSIETIKQYCEISEAEQSLLRSPKAPIVLLAKKSIYPIAPSVAPNNPALGCMIAYSPLHKVLFSKCGVPLVMTSANHSEEPIAYKVNDAKKRMQGIADIALIHNREIHMFADDSVTRVVNGSRRVWRRSRGYVPEPILVPEVFHKQTLAFGPQMKNTFCLGRNNSALLSQHMGDLENEHALNAQKKALDHFLKVFHAQPELIACDLHPDYASTRLAEVYSAEHSLPLVHIQHHHAHHVSCLTENGITDEAIGLALDGTGYGTDGTIWGGEILIGDARQFTRAGYLYPVPLLGGERAVKEPWRMALSWLHECFGEDALDLPIEFIEKLKSNISRESLPVLLNPNLLEHTFPHTSSLGRLFDAVSALTFFGMQKQFEGQAAMNLEWLLPSTIAKPYSVDILEKENAFIVSPMPMVLNLVDDLRDGVALPVISMRFHEGVVDGFVRVCEKVRAIHGLTTVTLSGGCFQNAYLQTRFEEKLSQLKFRVLTHHHVPTNDGGVSLGQAVIANAKKE